mmetsp:Transcript_2334/g.3864  ORF Transcript_2334/g.3864 Transcript_2334/m.3864 type:complete len:173 (+) Transcript_2334:105-623(+)
MMKNEIENQPNGSDNTKQLSFLEDAELHKRLLYGTSVLTLGTGLMVGFFSSLRRFGGSEGSLKRPPGAMKLIAKSFLGGTALCMISAVVVVQSVKAFMGVETIPEFNNKMRNFISSKTQKYRKQKPTIENNEKTEKPVLKDPETASEWWSWFWKVDNNTKKMDKSISNEKKD